MGFPGTIEELKNLLSSKDTLDEELQYQIKMDKRVGVQKLYLQQQKKIQKQKEEIERLQKLFLWEKKIGGPETLVAGVDEAGRGPLAGPVVAAAVILSPDELVFDLKDSKKLSPKKRQSLSKLIREQAVDFSIGIASPQEIDRYNIHQASFMAMRRALASLKYEPAHALVDGWKIPALELPQTSLVGGDNISASIAAASILAKVHRDEIMEQLHHDFPEYGFSNHKGYPTQEHLAALKSFGPSKIHRLTFKGTT